MNHDELTSQIGPAPVSKTIETLRMAGGEVAAQLRASILSVLIMTALLGGLFPIVVLGLGSWAFPRQAAGSLIESNGSPVGSDLIGQRFVRPEYFHPRPSAAGGGYDATASGGTNYATTGAAFEQQVRQAVQRYRFENNLPQSAAVPVDAVTSSASGLDPHISPENATLQIPRVARVRGVDEGQIRRLVAESTEGSQLGFLGRPRVSVLALDLALDRKTSHHD